MFRNLRLVCAAALVASSLLPSLASAAVVYRYRSAGASASAIFISVDPTGCLYTDISLFVYERRVREGPGQPEHETWIDLFGFQLDACNGNSVSNLYASTIIPDGDFRAHGLESASLQTTIEVPEYAVPMTLDLVWTGEGEISGSRRTRTGRYRGSVGMYMMLYKGVFRSADVSGSILFDSRNLADTDLSGGDIADNVEADMIVRYGHPD